MSETRLNQNNKPGPKDSKKDAFSYFFLGTKDGQTTANDQDKLMELENSSDIINRAKQDMSFSSVINQTHRGD
jgi:hypothetical protein